MVNEGSHIIMEVSSHGLDLDRVLDATSTMSSSPILRQTISIIIRPSRIILRAESFSESLMQSQKRGRFAVTNSDDPRGEEMVKGVDLPVIRYGMGPSCDVTADQMVSTFDGLSCRLKTPKGEFSVHSTLMGRYNLYNIMAAVATSIGMDIPLKTIKDGVEALEGVSGRFEKVENRKGIHIIVDYAHTHDALERVLLGIRNIQEDGKVITVFGCGGDRDRDQTAFDRNGGWKI
jgi:UDP-N-acetylmuramoyl-L-alanyl-D-glutamate--2,6-diaminopimelate ligase